MQHQLDHEKLDVYQIELQFVSWSTDLMVELIDSPAAKTRRVAEAPVPNSVSNRASC
ncbi:MAG: hypothetical protein K8T26_03420 [Lentisphaerae bacterium]|nr:hypothetical protein [Lentisphaerota bacterium]